VPYSVGSKSSEGICDVCGEIGRIYYFNTVVLGRDLATGIELVAEHSICIGCIGVVVDLAETNSLPDDYTGEP
jgi:hypothetical protein